MVFLFKGLVQLQMKYMAQEKMIPTMDVFFQFNLYDKDQKVSPVSCNPC